MHDDERQALLSRLDIARAATEREVIARLAADAQVAELTKEVDRLNLVLHDASYGGRVGECASCGKFYASSSNFDCGTCKRIVCDACAGRGYMTYTGGLNHCKTCVPGYVSSDSDDDGEADQKKHRVG